MSLNPFDLTGKVALITGGNGGIGLGIARGLVGAGAGVSIWGTNDTKNQHALEQLNSLKPEPQTVLSAHCCDVASEDSVARAFARTLETHGRVDGCFANAGVGGGAPFEDMSLAEWRRVNSVNLEGAFLTFRYAVSHMKQRAVQGDAGGRLIGTASLAARSGQPRGEHYAATKGGLVSMMKALAVEYARYGITANAILPGWIETEMTENAMSNEKFVTQVLKRIPMRRWGTPDDFAGIAIYLMSDASSYHSADSFLIDGGYLAF